jgi:hypothetical protein
MKSYYPVKIVQIEKGISNKTPTQPKNDLNEQKINNSKKKKDTLKNEKYSSTSNKSEKKKQASLQNSLKLPQPEKNKKSDISIDEREQKIINYYDEVIDRLIAFVAALFTVIAIITALAGLSVWRRNKENQEKYEHFEQLVKDKMTQLEETISKKMIEFSKFEGTVKFIKERNELACWAMDKFDSDAKKTVLSKLVLPLDEPGDERKYKEIKEKIVEEATNDSWLKLIYAKKLLEENHFNNLSKFRAEQNFLKIEKLYKYIENRDLLNEQSRIGIYLFNLKGQLYWEWYKYMKRREPGTKNKNSTQKTENWNKENDDKFQFLEKSINAYKAAIYLEKQKNDSDPDESYGNLAVRLIEKSKYCQDEEIEFEKNKKKDILELAKEILERIREKTFHTYWDYARAQYYIKLRTKKQNLNYEELTPIIEILKKSAKKIYYNKDKEFFIETMEKELNEAIWEAELIGFPGNKNIINELEKIVDDKKLHII